MIGAHTTTKRQFSRDDVSFLAAVSNVIGTARQREQAEDAVRRQAEQHEAILATTSDGFWVYDRDARIVDVNDVYCRMSGYTREELLSMRVADIEASMTEAQILERMRRCVIGDFDRFETVHRAKDGHLFDVEISMAYGKQDQFVRVRAGCERAQAGRAGDPHAQRRARAAGRAADRGAARSKRGAGGVRVLGLARPARAAASDGRLQRDAVSGLRRAVGRARSALSIAGACRRAADGNDDRRAAAALTRLARGAAPRARST